MTGPQQSLAGISRLLVIGTGSVAAAHLPFWANWLYAARPATRTRFVLTPTAERFVSREALTAISGELALQDRWPSGAREQALHVDLAQWPQAVLVFPATLHFVARLALGLGDSPALLALQCTAAPVVLAPALPPGGAESSAYVGHLRRLAARPRLSVLPPRPDGSMPTGRGEAWAPATFPEALGEAGRLLAGHERS